MIFDQASKFKAHLDVVETVLPTGEIVLLHLGTKAYYSLNKTGSRIWKLATSDATVGQICQDLEAAYELTDEEALKSVCTLLDELTAANLLISGSDRS